MCLNSSNIRNLDLKCLLKFLLDDAQHVFDLGQVKTSYELLAGRSILTLDAAMPDIYRRAASS